MNRFAFYMSLLGVVGLSLPGSLSAQHMYWTDGETGTIQRAQLDGSGVETLVTGFGVSR